MARLGGFGLLLKLRILPEQNCEIERRFDATDLAQVPEYTGVGTAVPLTVAGAWPIVIGTRCVHGNVYGRNRNGETVILIVTSLAPRVRGSS